MTPFFMKKFIIISIVSLLPFTYLLYKNYSFSKEHRIFGVEIPEGFNSLGIDVSHHQGIINWELLSHHFKETKVLNFVYLKATEGTDYIDREYANNRNSCVSLSLPHGAYHFFNPKKAPLPQADHFLNIYNPADTDLPPVLDVEIEGFSDKDLIHKMKRWLTSIEEKTGKRPVIYTSYSFYVTKFKDEFKNYKFWVAAYSIKPDILNDSRIIHWQFTEKAKLPNHKSFVDLNVSKIHFD